MDSELSTLSSVLEAFDKSLFCKRTGDGVVRVYHHKYVMRPYDLDGETYFFPQDEPYHVFSLTDTWGFSGRPVKYGTLLIREKLKSLEDGERILRDIEESERRAEDLRSKRSTSRAQDMAYEFRDAVKKDTENVLTHSLDRKKDKRRIYDKRIKGVS